MSEPTRTFTPPDEVADFLQVSFSAAGWTACPACGRWRERERCIPCEGNNAPTYGGDLVRLQAERDAAVAELAALRAMVYRFLISGGVTAPELLARIRGTEDDL
jgi:hypothetical protein